MLRPIAAPTLKPASGEKGVASARLPPSRYLRVVRSRIVLSRLCASMPTANPRRSIADCMAS